MNAKKSKKTVEIQFFSLFGGYFSTKWAQLSFFYHILGLLTCLSITLSSPIKNVCQIQFSYSLNKSYNKNHNKNNNGVSHLSVDSFFPPFSVPLVPLSSSFHSLATRLYTIVYNLYSALSFRPLVSLSACLSVCESFFCPAAHAQMTYLITDPDCTWLG